MDIAARKIWMDTAANKKPETVTLIVSLSEPYSVYLVVQLVGGDLSTQDIHIEHVNTYVLQYFYEAYLVLIAAFRNVKLLLHMYNSN